MGHDQDVIVETKKGTNSVKFKETEFQAKVQSRLLTLRFGAYGLLSLVMTLPWLMSFILVFSGADPILWYPFIIFLGLQVSTRGPRIARKFVPKILCAIQNRTI